MIKKRNQMYKEPREIIVTFIFLRWNSFSPWSWPLFWALKLLNREAWLWEILCHDTKVELEPERMQRYDTDAISRNKSYENTN